MCSGVLMLRPEKELTMKKLYTHSLPRLLIALFVWAVLYMLLRGVLDRELSAAYLGQCLRDVLLFRHEFHLYYLHIMLLVYVWLPVTRQFVTNASKRHLEYALLVWFILGILYPTLRNFWPFDRLQGIPAQWMLNMTYAAIGYGVLGYYLWRLPANQNRHRMLGSLLLTLGLAIAVGGVWGMSLAGQATDLRLWEGMSLGPACMAAGIFLLGGTVNDSRHDRLCRCCRHISKASFSIYLSHMAVLYLLREVGWSVTDGAVMLRIPVTGLLIFCCSYGLYLLLRQVPVVNRWLL